MIREIGVFPDYIADTVLVDGLILLDIDHRITGWSDGVSALLGIIVEQAIGKPIGEVLRQNLAKFDPPEFLDRLTNAIGNTNGLPEEVRGSLSGQQQLELTIEVLHSRIHHNQPATALLLRDITGTLKAKRHREIFIQGLSHEFLEHVTAIVGWADLMRKENSVNHIQTEGLETIHRRGWQLNEVARNLLGAVQSNAGNINVMVQPLNLADVVQATIESISPNMSKYRFDLEIESNLPSVAADSAMLTQVLRNLISNAIKYSPMGGRITVSASFESAENQVVVSVADEGPGLDAADQDSIFAPFRNAPTICAQDIGGIGLGLYIVKQFVKYMNGEMRVVSNPGRGATFSFTLPSVERKKTIDVDGPSYQGDA